MNPTVKVERPEPVTPPPATVTLTLSEDDAVQLAALLGRSGAAPPAIYRIYEALYVAGMGATHPDYKKYRFPNK